MQKDRFSAQKGSTAKGSDKQSFGLPGDSLNHVLAWDFEEGWQGKERASPRTFNTDQKNGERSNKKKWRLHPLKAQGES